MGINGLYSLNVNNNNTGIEGDGALSTIKAKSKLQACYDLTHSHSQVHTLPGSCGGYNDDDDTHSGLSLLVFIECFHLKLKLF